MNRIIRYTSILLLCISAISGFSQEGISVRATIDRNKILIGEPVVLQLEATMASPAPAGWFATDSIPHFDLIKKGKIDTATGAGGTVYRQVLTITSFDSGRWVIPFFSFEVGNRDYHTDSLAVSVAYTPLDPQQDYHDIKDIIAVDNSTLRYLNWFVLGAALIALLAIVLLLRRKNRKPPAKTEKPAAALSPLEEAVRDIERLLQQPGDPAHAKIFYSSLNDILRRYLNRRSKQPTMEKTSRELLQQLKRYPLRTEQMQGLEAVLLTGDAVKFARYVPVPAQQREDAGYTRKVIEQLDTVIT